MYPFYLCVTTIVYASATCALIMVNKPNAMEDDIGGDGCDEIEVPTLDDEIVDTMLRDARHARRMSRLARIEKANAQSHAYVSTPSELKVVVCEVGPFL